MPIKVNLLPNELRVSGGVAQFLRISRMLGVIALAVFLVFGIGLGAFFAISTIELNNLNSTNDSLKSQLSVLSKTEAQLVVLKDRIAKIKIAEAIPSATKNLSDFNPFLSTLSPSTKVGELDVDPSKITVSMVFGSNSDLNAFVNSVSAATVFQNVTVSSFSFNPASGYLIGISIKSK